MPMWVSHQLSERVYRADAAEITAIATRTPLIRLRLADAADGGPGAPGTCSPLPVLPATRATGMTVTSGTRPLLGCWRPKLSREDLCAPVFLGTRYHPQATRMTNRAIIKAAITGTSIPTSRPGGVAARWRYGQIEASGGPAPVGPSPPRLYRLQSPDLPPVFSSKRIGPITAPLSSPFTMS